MMHGAKKIELKEMPVKVDRPTERTQNHDLADKALLEAVTRKQQEMRERRLKPKD